MRSVLIVLMAFAIPAVMADVTFYDSAAAFNAAIFGWQPIGGVENFEENDLLPGQAFGIPAPLTYGVPNDHFPTGIDQHMTIQNNRYGSNPLDVWPGSPDGTGIGVLALGFGIGESSDIVVASTASADSFDTIFGQTAEDAFAVSWDSVNIDFFGQTPDPVVVHVFDEANVLIGVGYLPVSPGGSFGAVVADVPIGRINLFEPVGVDPAVGSFEGMDNIAVFTPEPGGLLLLGLGAVAVLRRR